MNNVKLTVPDMKEMIELFVRHKLHALKIGDFELQKNYYESGPSDNKASLQEDLTFFSAPQLPPEMEALLASMQPK